MKRTAMLFVFGLAGLTSCSSINSWFGRKEFKMCWPGEEFEFSNPEYRAEYFFDFVNNLPFLRHADLMRLIEERKEKYPYTPGMPYMTVRVEKGLINVKVYHVDGMLFYNQDYFYDSAGLLKESVKESGGWKMRFTAIMKNGLWVSDHYIFNPEGSMLSHSFNAMLSTRSKDREDSDYEKIVKEEVIYQNKAEYSNRYEKNFLGEYGTFNLRNNPYGHCR